MRFRLVWPVLSVILAVILLRVGDMQIEKVLDGRRPDRGGEPVPDSYARAKYFDYALNAPAWATLGEERGMLWHRSTLWSGNLRYFVAVVGMWYLLGLQLDNKLDAKKTDGAPQRTWRRRIVAIMCALYGLFLCRLMLPEFVPLRGYGYWLPLRKYELWFIATVLAWGAGLMFAGLYSLFRRAHPN